jgi:hypothetical protein
MPASSPKRRLGFRKYTRREICAKSGFSTAVCPPPREVKKNCGSHRIYFTYSILSKKECSSPEATKEFIE